MALKGIKVLELGGLAPAAFCSQILGDFGAKIIRLERSAFKFEMGSLFCNRGKTSIFLNLKKDWGQDAFARLVSDSDVLINPFRPGFLENIRFPEDHLHSLNKSLIIAHISSFGHNQHQQHRADDDDDGAISKRSNSAAAMTAAQSHWHSKYAQTPAHDINFLAVSGLLSKLVPSITTNQSESALQIGYPINILGDFAAGSLSAALAILLALFQRTQNGGLGQSLDCNMTANCSYLASFQDDVENLPLAHLAASLIMPRPHQNGANFIDGGAPFYRYYRTKSEIPPGNNNNDDDDDAIRVGGEAPSPDYVAVGALEPKFYRELLRLLEIGEGSEEAEMTEMAAQMDVAEWPRLHREFARRFAGRTRAEWMRRIAQFPECCVHPVLSMREAIGTRQSRDALIPPGIHLRGGGSLAMDEFPTRRIAAAGESTMNVLRNLQLFSAEKLAEIERELNHEEDALSYNIFPSNIRH